MNIYIYIYICIFSWKYLVPGRGPGALFGPLDGVRQSHELVGKRGIPN